MMPLDPTRAELAEVRARRMGLRAELESAARSLASRPSEEEAANLRSRILQLRRGMDALRSGELRRLDTLSHPRDFLSQLDDMVPILLMPLRLETRWDQSDGRMDLLVRVYPDDISVQTHDRTLRLPELNAGRAFWGAPLETDDPKVRTQREIWRGMAGEFGLRRAAWIREATKPGAAPPVVSAGQLSIPAAWTLPERLVFRFYGPNGLMFEMPGAPIPDGLEMSFDLTKQDLGFVNNDEELGYPSELSWQVNFDEAVKVGMAVRFSPAQFGASRVERLLVLGVRLSTDTVESAALFENLIEDHRYTEGFSFIRQGTPTNVTHEGEKPSVPDADDYLKQLQGSGAFEDGEPEATLYQNENDGLRFAHALGISPESIRRIEGAGSRDGVEAIAMNRALWAGTLGYYVQQMLAPYFEREVAGDPFRGERMMSALRFFFTNFVSGRGPLPAIRVGDQPYGILPVSASSLKRPIRGVRPWPIEFLGSFSNELQEKLAILALLWVALARDVPRAGAGVQADDRLLSILAQQPSSVEFRSERLIGPEYLSTYTAFKDKAKHDAGIAEFQKLLAARAAAFQFFFPGLFPDQPPRIFDLSFFGGVWKATLEGLKKFDRGSAGVLLSGDVVDNLPFSEVREIATEYPNYIEPMAAGAYEAVRAGIVRTKPDQTKEPVTALLYLLLRHSYLYEHALAAMRLHRHLRNVPPSEFREKELHNLLFTFDANYWSYLEEREDWVLPGIGARRAAALDLIGDRRNLLAVGGLWPTFFGGVEEQREALSILAKLKTARLERLFAEHIDTASYRLDAWYTALAYERLLGWRVRGDAVPVRGELDSVHFQFNEPMPYQTRGLYLGAYGWLENLHPDPAGVPVDDLPTELRPRDGRQVTRDPDNFGLVHAPSLNHAVTAAVLRSGSVTQPDRSAFNIDLSSARVREAIWIIEGIRNGQMPAALLGYRFERIIGDMKLQGLLPDLRAAFPMPKPQETTTDQPLESKPPVDVVNGMLLVQSLRSDFMTRTLFAGPAQPKLAEAARRVADLLDAAGDLMLAESVHQAAQGNYERAGSVVTAAGEFTHLPAEFEVVQTPRSGASLTHRLLFGINTAAPGAGEGSPRARLEPDLNAWLAGVLPPMTTMLASVTYSFTVAEAEQLSEHLVAASDLGLEPIDLLWAAEGEESPELSARIDAAARPLFEAANPGAAPQKIRVAYFPEVEAGSRALGELLPLMDSLRMLLAQSRGATRRELIPASLLHEKQEDELTGADLPDLILRVFGVSAGNPGLQDEASLWFSFIAARDALAEDPAATIEEWKGRLQAASLFGIPEAVPALPADAAEALEALRRQAARVFALMNTRSKEVLSKWTAPAVPKESIVELASEVTRILLGGSFPLMPRILPDDGIPAVFAGATPQQVEDWLFGAAQVREPARMLQDARTLSLEFSAALPPLEARQGPGDLPVWIAGELPAEHRTGELTSFTIQPAAAGLDLGQPFGALIIDEWNELLPQEAETTGVSYHYDAPNTEPPQSLLLAVSDRALESNGWTWDQLVGCAEQALEMAKIRAVTPDQLRKMPLDVVLPATYSADAATPATIGLTWLVNVSAKAANTMLEAYKRS